MYNTAPSKVHCVISAVQDYLCETVQLGESSVSTGGPLVSHGKSLFVFVSVGRTMCVKVAEHDHVTPTAVPSHQGWTYDEQFWKYLRFHQNDGILIPVQILCCITDVLFLILDCHFYSITVFSLRHL